MIFKKEAIKNIEKQMDDFIGSEDELFAHSALVARDKNIALLYYAKIGNERKINECLEQQGCDINYAHFEYGTVLTNAIENNHSNIVIKLLPDSKIKINKPNRYRETPLIMAIKKGDVEIANQLLKHPDIDLYYQSFSGSPLTVAIFYERYELAKKSLVLEKENKNINSVNPGALLCAVRNDNAEMIQLLINAGFDVNSTGEEGFKSLPNWVFDEDYVSPFTLQGPLVFDLPIIIAMQENKLQALTVLLKEGASLSKKGPLNYDANELLNSFAIAKEVKDIINNYQQTKIMNQILYIKF